MEKFIIRELEVHFKDSVLAMEGGVRGARRGSAVRWGPAVIVGISCGDEALL